MKATKPPKASASADAGVRAYRKAEATPVVTAPVVTELAQAALSLLARHGVPDDEGCRMTRDLADGTQLDISCSGPGLPDLVPMRTIHPTEIPKERPWVATWRLRVGAPLVAFDIAWRADEPLRILQFSRGDWEDALLALAG